MQGLSSRLSEIKVQKIHQKLNFFLHFLPFLVYSNLKAEKSGSKAGTT